MESNTDMRQETLSALMDGQLSGAALADALQSAGSAEARESWRVYHLVGDVLRCPDLARGARDLAFVQRVSQQMGAPAAGLAGGELAVQAVPAAGARRGRAAANDEVFRWKVVAGLASVAAVTAIGWSALGDLAPAPEGQPLRVVAVNAPAAQPAPAPDLRAAASAAQTMTLLVAASAPAAAASLPTPANADDGQTLAQQSAEQAADDGQPVMLRDARLDELLAAHRATTGAWALGGAGFLRNATYEGGER